MDAINAVEQAFFTELSVPGAVPGATVLQHAVSGSDYPIVLIGDIDTVQPIARSYDPDRSMRVSILVLTEGEERKPCLDLIELVTATLNGRGLTVASWTITPSFEFADARLADDGAGYVGLVQFTVFALLG